MNIRKMKPKDFSAMATIMLAAEAEHGTGSIPSIHEVIAMLQYLPEGVEFMLAENEQGVITGFSSYSILYPAMGSGLGTTLYLKEVYVDPAFRKQGIATQLMAALAHAAENAGCERMGWTAPKSAEAALALYDKLGAKRADWLVTYRMSGDALTKLAAKDKSRFYIGSKE